LKVKNIDRIVTNIVRSTAGLSNTMEYSRIIKYYGV